MKIKIYTLLLFLISTCLSTAQVDTNRFKRVDEHVKKMPITVRNTVPTIAEFIMEGAYTDEEAVRGIYSWCTNKVDYNWNLYLYMNNLTINALPEAYQTFGNKMSYFFYKISFTKRGKRIAKQNSLAYILKKRKAICQGYSKLFDALCEERNIRSETVIGYNKGYGHYEGDSFYYSNHSWNAVFFENEWHLMDLTFDYWDIHPDSLVQTHLPAMPMWQLSEHPITMDMFETDDFGVMDDIAAGTPRPEIRYLVRKSKGYGYKDTIALYLTGSETDKAFMMARDLEWYNPKNYRDRAIALIDYADYMLVERYSENIPDEAKTYIKDTLISTYKTAKDYFKKAKAREIKQVHLRNKERNKMINKFVKNQVKLEIKSRKTDIKEENKKNKEELKAAKKKTKEEIAEQKKEDKLKVAELKELGKREEATELKEENTEKLENMRYMSDKMLSKLEQSNMKKGKKVEKEKGSEILSFEQMMKKEKKRYEKAKKLEDKRYKGDKTDIKYLQNLCTARYRGVKSKIKVRVRR